MAANDVTALEKVIKDICEKKKCNHIESIIEHSKKFDIQKMYTEYIELYSNVLED